MLGWTVVLGAVVAGAAGDLFTGSPRADLDFPGLVQYDGYKSETHEVATADGYLLGLFRLPMQGDCATDPSRKPILFMHGLYLGGDDSIVPGPGIAHAYVYSDECYDVWVGNARGNRYSRRHEKLDPDADSQFWDFSFHEMGIYDLPAMIDYILAQTGHEQITFVSHSQGATMLLVLAAEKPEYNAKVSVAFAMSPTAWLDHARFSVVLAMGALAPFLTQASKGDFKKEVLAHGSITQEAAEALCRLSVVGYPVCSVGLFALLGYNRFQISDKTLPVVVGHSPAGTSVQDVAHWGQVKDHGFRKYDFGSAAANQQAYGQSTPPEYNLSANSLKWILIGSHNDYVAGLEDLAKLQSKLPNARTCVVKDNLFQHLDFVYGDGIPKLITPLILQKIENDDGTCNYS